MDEPARILAVDDSITIRKALEMILAPEGFQVELAASGAEAIEKAREFQPDLILLDFILPDMRGSDVCRALAGDPLTSGVPIVLISARGAEIRQAYLDAENVLEYLVKPFTPEDVYAVVNTVLASGTEVTMEEAETASEAPLAATPVEEIPQLDMPETTVPAAEPVVFELQAEAEEPIHEEVEAPAFEPVAEASFQTPAELVAEVSEPAAPPAIEETTPPLAASAWDDGAADTDADLDLDEPLFTPAQEGARREMFESMFETLRAGLEGVYVEESDTPPGAIADHARSYTELASLLAQQLGETLEHARSGSRFALGGDGSIRSLNDALLDTHRRVCRLLFRAVAAGVIEGQPTSPAQVRLLVVSDGTSFPAAALAPLSEQNGWNVFHIGQSFSQLPIMARCYGPTHVVIDLGNEAALAQLSKLQRQSDSRRLKVIGIRNGAEVDAETIARHGLTAVLTDSPTLADDLRDFVIHGRMREVPAPVTAPAPPHSPFSFAEASAAL